MKHHAGMRKLGRVRNQRKALLRTLARSLITKGKIKTTQARAKELRPFAERLVTIAKKDTVTARRVVAARLGSSKDIPRLFTYLAPKYADRNGGYTRITKLPPRQGDASPEAIIEFV